MQLKDLPVKIKAGPDDGLGEGQFSAYASVFGNVDSYGDIVVKGAFEKDLARWEESGNPIPLLFGHNMSDPDYNLGQVLTAAEDDHGLLVTAQLDLENPKAMQVYRMLKGRRINQMSYAYDVVDEGEVDTESDGVKANELRELKLYEISVVTIGANQETEVLAVKAGIDALLDGVKRGRTFSAANEKAIDSIADQMISGGKELKNVLAAASGESDDQGKASGDAEAKSGASDEEPAAAKSSVSDEEPKQSPSARVLAAHTHLTLIGRN